MRILTALLVFWLPLPLAHGGDRSVTLSVHGVVEAPSKIGGKNWDGFGSISPEIADSAGSIEGPKGDAERDET